MKAFPASLLITLPALLLAPTAAFAQAEPSETQQRFACMGDAVRLCAQHIPNREAIRACMAAQHARLSEGCRPVFDASMKARGLKLQ